MRRLLTTIILGSFILTGCNKAETRQTDSKTQAKSVIENTNGISGQQVISNSQPTYDIVIDAAYPPYSYRDKNGNMVGFEIDIINEISETEGFNVNFVAIDPNKKMNLVDEQSADIFASGMLKTDELEKVLDFSKPFATTEIVGAFITDDVTKSIDITENTMVIDHHNNFDHLVIAKDHHNANKVKYAPSSYMSFKNMINGKVTSYIDDITVVNYYINHLDDLTDTTTVKYLPIANGQKIERSFAVLKGNDELLNKLNKGLDTLHSNGSYENIQSKWKVS